MAYQPIIVKTATSSGDALSSNLQKTNENFAELYSAIAAANGDFSSIAGDVVPSIDEEFNLGSPTKKWASLYVSENTIYLGTTALGINASGSITINDVVIGGGDQQLEIDGGNATTQF
jgi:hypothetical protein